jgi:hypothetical protein
MSEQITPSKLWDAIEVAAKHSQDTLRVGFPLIPLAELRPFWNSAVGARIDSTASPRLDTQGDEVQLLKAEIQRLTRELEQVTGAA